MNVLKPPKHTLTFSAHRLPSLQTDPEKLPAFILCSSGTTGLQKASPYSHAACPPLFQSERLKNSKVILAFSTIFWGSGLIILFRSTLDQTTRIIVNHPFDAKLCLDIIRTRQVEFAFLTPTQTQLLLQERFDREIYLKSLKWVATGGGPTPDSVIEQFPVPLIIFYGMSETSLTGSSNGQLTPGVKVQIVDDQGHPVGVNESGEIWIRPPFPFLGYIRDAEATKGILLDGFVKSGDVGIFDESGLFRVVDRKKDIFKVNNFHVNPLDLEKKLKNVSGVSLISVVGIPHTLGCLPAAAIVRESGSNLTVEQVHNYAKENLEQYKWLRGGVYFFGELPMTASGKIQRGKILEKVTEMFKNNPDIGYEY